MPEETLTKGPRGDRGPQGIPGLKGDKGERGIQGFEGEKGDQGEKGERGERGPIGLEGERGPKGEKGDKGDKGERGQTGPAGRDGKDGDIAEAKLIAEVKAKSAVQDHEAKFDHTLIDPFLVGSKKLSEAGMKDGDVITFDAKGNRLIYTTIKQVASKVTRLAGRGLSLPSQAGNSGKFLTTNGTRASWATIVGGGAISFADKEVPSGTVNGSNVTFTLAETPTSGSEHLFLNGVLQKDGGNDYSISGGTITFVTAPETGATLLVSYRY